MPQRPHFDRNPSFGQPATDFCQRQTGLGFDPGAHFRLQAGDTRAPMATDLKTGAFARLLDPIAHLVHPAPADLQPPSNMRRFFPPLQRPKHTIPQVL